jgi:hypothetical protein
VAAHFKYLNRRPEFEIETDAGEHLRGRGSVKELVEDWDLELDAAEAQSAYWGRPGRKPVKLVHNIVLSMPAFSAAVSKSPFFSLSHPCCEAVLTEC